MVLLGLRSKTTLEVPHTLPAFRISGWKLEIHFYANHPAPCGNIKFFFMCSLDPHRKVDR